jgi:Tol biopolymer transport system component
VAATLAVGLLPATPAEAAFPGFNGKLSFLTGRDGNGEVYTMNSGGTGQTNASTNAASDQYPSWSADGTKVAFASNRDGNYEIYVMNADGSGQTRLTNNTATDISPGWSPDGTQIVFMSNRDGGPPEIYKMNADGSSQTNLTNNPALDAGPVWSPDGTTIAFSTTRSGNQEIYVMNADGSSPTRLTNNPASDELPDWSPNGTQLVFDSNRDGNQEIYKMNAVGANQTRITNNSAADTAAVWSPDGTKIAFQTDRDSNAEVYVMNADGSGQTNVSNNSAADQSPDWQPAGVDSVPPETTIDLGQSGTTTNATPTFAFSSSESGSSFQCSLDAAPFASCTSPYTTTALASGSHTFQVRAIDPANNVDPSPATNSFSVYSLPPVLPALPALPAPTAPAAGAAPQAVPVLTSLRVSPSAFRAANSGAGVSYLLSANATVTFKAERAMTGRKRGGKCRKARAHAKGKRCTHYVAVKGSFSVTGLAGPNRFAFPGRISNHRLARGKYRLTATPSAAGKTGASVRASFTVK